MHERALSEMCIRTKNLAQPVDEYADLCLTAASVGGECECKTLADSE
ncbi:hypothetical protein CBJ57_000282 [Salmonella enterica subsp. enterica serovar Amina]|nr:hypothetical protein [Salmonella enterica subsp. enterica serovar Amina]